VCERPVDLGVGPTAPGAPTIDHVLPKALGGDDHPSNLRLAHRHCNGRRGSRLPELHWPARFIVSDPAPLWPVVRRALRRPGEWEVVGLLASAREAEEASAWLAGALADVLGQGWETRVAHDGSGPWRLGVRRDPSARVAL
jgi:hypothetical protein